MKLWTFFACVFVLGATACAGGEEGTAADGGADARRDGTTTTPDAGKPGDGGGQCTSLSCTTNAQCQSACVAPPNGGVWCCDGITNTCYATSGTCGGGFDAGDSGSMY
jgi:hypothetical protein